MQCPNSPQLSKANSKVLDRVPVFSGSDIQGPTNLQRRRNSKHHRPPALGDLTTWCTMSTASLTLCSECIWITWTDILHRAVFLTIGIHVAFRAYFSQVVGSCELDSESSGCSYGASCRLDSREPLSVTSKDGASVSN